MLKISLDLIQYPALVAAPGGGDKKRLGPVAGEPVDDQIRTDMGDTKPQKFQVFFQGGDPERPVFIDRCQVRALKDVEKLQLQALDIQAWWVLDPLLFMGVYTFVARVVFRAEVAWMNML